MSELDLAAIRARVDLSMDKIEGPYIRHSELAALLDRLEAAEATIKRARELHKAVEMESGDTICAECSWQLPNGRYFGQVVAYPCPTIRALDGEASDE